MNVADKVTGLTGHQRRVALGTWGERKALILLARSGFQNLRDVNAETRNHPFGDIYAERAGQRYLIGVKTRNKYQESGSLNPTYNIKKNGMDVRAISRRYNDAELAWLTIQVIPERQIMWSYFGTIALIEENGVRFSVRMQETQTPRYECLADAENDTTIRPEWTNGGYARIRR